MSISSATTRNDCIMVAMKRSEAMIRSYAQTHDLDFEDLYQDMAELMLHVWERMPADMESPTPYLYGAARLQMRLVVRRMAEHAIPTTSLDIPVVGDKLTLEGMIQAEDIILRTKEEQEQEEIRLDRIAETVHDVLHESCMLEEQEYAVRTFGMTAFEPMPNDIKRVKATRRISSTGRSAGNIRESIKKVFRKNGRVLGLL
jgi:hypothetical protein